MPTACQATLPARGQVSLAEVERVTAELGFKQLRREIVPAAFNANLRQAPRPTRSLALHPCMYTVVMACSCMQSRVRMRCLPRAGAPTYRRTTALLQCLLGRRVRVPVACSMSRAEL